jgi:hypothetical protein
MPRNFRLEALDISLLLYSLFISLKEPFLVKNNLHYRMEKVTEIIIILCCKYCLISPPDVRNRLSCVTVLFRQIFQICVVFHSLDLVLIRFSPSTYLINTAFTFFNFYLRYSQHCLMKFLFCEVT